MRPTDGRLEATTVSARDNAVFVFELEYVILISGTIRKSRERLQLLLYWLTQDEWSLIFQTRKPRPRLAELEQFLFADPAEAPATVSLFSGGLDSLRRTSRSRLGREPWIICPGVCLH